MENLQEPLEVGKMSDSCFIKKKKKKDEKIQLIKPALYPKMQKYVKSGI